MEQKQISSDLIRGHIDTIILYTLTNGDKFAEQISDTICEKSENAYKINQATLYSALKRLENLKLVNSYQRDAVGGGRRKFFSLTQSGKDTVENNLSSWSYSRSIIDKLVDCQSEPIIKTEYIEKIIQIPTENVASQPVVNEVLDTNSLIPDVTQEIKQDTILTSPETVQTENSSSAIIDEANEVNFRNILNGLIEQSNSRRQEQTIQAVELVPIEKNDSNTDVNDTKNEQKIEKPVKDFNQIIKEKHSNSIKTEITTIDFSDLKLKAAQEGYKLRISAKNQTANTGTLLINKVRLLTCLAVFLCFIAELLFFSTAYKTELDMPNWLIFTLLACGLFFPIFYAVKYKKKPLLTTAKAIHADSILTTGIIVFNLLLINFALVLLFELNFAVKKDVLLYLIIPIVVYVNVLLCSIFRVIFANLKSCQLKQ